MQSTELIIWIADLSAAEPDRRWALTDGRELASRAFQEELVAGGDTGAQALSRAFAEAREDGWIACDYEGWPGDHEIPPRYAFRDQHLQRCRNIRLTHTGWQAVPALRESLRPSRDGQDAAPGSTEKQFDIFICHATEDKDGVAGPIARRLTEADWRVWFDDFELRVGDHLRAGIDRGLARSRYGAVILSPAFLARKPWTEHELDGLMSREVAGGGEKVILPIWHEVGFDEVSAYSSALAGRVASQTAQGLDRVIADLDFVLRGDEGGPPAVRPSVPVVGGNPDAAQQAPAPAEEPGPQSAISAARGERVARARQLIDAAVQQVAELPWIAREALYQYFHARRPVTVGGAADTFTLPDAQWAVEHGFLYWADDEPQALTLRHEQPAIAEAEAALRRVRQFVFDGEAQDEEARAGEWVRPLLKEDFGISDPTFELRPVWQALGFL